MSKLVLANWKSTKNIEELKTWMTGYKLAKVATFSQLQVAIAPPMVLLPALAAELGGDPKTQLAVQDLSPFPPGAYTGAVSAENLIGYDVKYAILGHSERRRYFHETNQEIANKVEQALGANIIPVVCVDTDYTRTQAAAIAPELLNKCVVAYEPLAAIGSGISQSLAEVEEALDLIHATFGQASVLYGGSVSQANVAEFLSVTDGVLVATHSFDIDDFVAVLKAAEAGLVAAN